MLETASCSENHQADLLGLEIAETPVPRGKGTTQCKPELRMLRNMASMSVQPSDCYIRALGNSKHWECLGRGCISDSVFVWDSNSYSLFGLFNPENNSEQAFWCWSDSPADLLLPCTTFQVIFFPHLVFFSGLKVTLSRVTVTSQKLASLWACRWAPFNDFGINQKKPHAKQTQISAVNLTPSYCTIIVFAPTGT